MTESAVDDANEAPDEGAPVWMTSFCDLTLLMLCFFVLLSSFAKTDASTFHSALGSVQAALGSTPRAAPAPAALPAPAAAPALAPLPASAKRVPPASLASADTNDHRLAQVVEYLAARGLADRVEVLQNPRGIVLRAKDSVLFGSAEATLEDSGTPVLDAIGALCQDFDGRLAVEGHSDDRPIVSPIFPSNWELSGARASAVLRYLLRAGVPAQMLHVGGYADTHPVASNDTEQGRAQNRRVEFVFEYGRGARESAAR